MKKFVLILLSIVMAVSGIAALSGCSRNEKASFDVVMITDGASIDDKAYNQYTWDGIKSFASEKDMSCRYYQPSLDEDGNLNTDVVENYIKLSEDNGAKFVVVQGEAYGEILTKLAPKYEKLNFLMLGSELTKPIHNVMTVSFDELQAGFLAGYTSVILGNKKLGYIGSVREKASALYGAGYLQGAGYCADETHNPSILYYANYDADNLEYDYSFTVRPVYIKASESKEETFKVLVLNGSGTGVYNDGQNVTIIADPAPEGKVFDHWEKKSNTEGKSDKKVNISSDKKSTMNLLVGDCDCTLKAVYTDATTYPVNIMKSGIVAATYNAVENSAQEIKAPAADSGMVFDHWQCDEDVLEDAYAATTKVNVTDHAVNIEAVYVKSDKPTFDVVVKQGTGSGSYRTDDYVEVVADPPKDGYMFYKWENIDNQGLSTGIMMDNEYDYKASFTMIDRYASLAKLMYNLGADVIFGGGNPQSESIFSATWNYSYQVYGFGWGTDQKDMGNCLASVVTDYNRATYNALSEYKGGTEYVGDCSNNCLYVTGMNTEATHKNDDGKEVKNEDYNEKYAKIYKALADGKINIKTAGADYDVRKLANYKCLTVNYAVKD